MVANFPLEDYVEEKGKLLDRSWRLRKECKVLDIDP